MLFILYCILVGDFLRSTKHLVHMDCLQDMIFYKCDLHIFYHLYSLRFRSIQFYGNQYVDFRGNQAHNYILVDGQLLNTQHAFHKSLLHKRQYTGSTIKTILNPLDTIEFKVYKVYFSLLQAQLNLSYKFLYFHNYHLWSIVTLEHRYCFDNIEILDN